MKIPYILILVLSTLLGACKSYVYDTMASDEKRECYDLPASQYHDCVMKKRKTYTEYMRQREEVLARE